VSRRRQDEDDYVDLRAPEHEWWAKRPTDPFAPVEPEEPADVVDAVEPVSAEDDRDDHVEPDPFDERPDPYAVLRLPTTATWDEIVANYRRLARWWHPDGLGAATEWGRAACEAKIRQLNGAYAELRIRRDR
jgi:DnaJ domain